MSRNRKIALPAALAALITLTVGVMPGCDGTQRESEPKTGAGKDAADAGPSLESTQAADTRVGKLEFEAGYPSEQTVEKLYDEMDFQRAVQAFLWSYPAVSFQSFYDGFKEADVDYFDFAIFVWGNKGY